MSPSEIQSALNATNLRPRDIREAERLVTKLSATQLTPAEVAMHREFIGTIWPIVRRAEAARKALKARGRQ